MLMLPAAVCKKLPGSGGGGKVMTHWPCRRSPWVGRMGRRMGDRRAPGPRVVATRHLAAWRAHARAPPAFSAFPQILFVRPDARGTAVACSGTPPRSLSVTGFSNRQFPLGVLRARRRVGDDDGRTGRVARARNAHRLSAGRPERLNARRPRLPVRAFPLAETWSGSV